MHGQMNLKLNKVVFYIYGKLLFGRGLDVFVCSSGGSVEIPQDGPSVPLHRLAGSWGT